MPKKYMKQYLRSSGMLYCIISQNKGISIPWWMSEITQVCDTNKKNLESQNETSDHSNKGFVANMTTLLKQQ